MVYHTTNFVYECNAWWLRRVRPVWMTVVGGWLFYCGFRYYFFGKNMALRQKYQDPEEMMEIAKHNKRNWGFRGNYKPKLEISFKNRLYEELGDNYKPAIEYQNKNMVKTRNFEDIMREENEDFEL